MFLSSAVRSRQIRPFVVSGFARNMDWKFLADESSDGVCVLELTETEETMKVHCRLLGFRRQLIGSQVAEAAQEIAIQDHRRP